MRRPVAILSGFWLLFCVGGVAFGGTIHVAAEKGDLPAINKLLAADPSLVNSPDKDGATPLHYAIAAGQKATAEMLLNKGADVDAKRKNGVTALHIAASRGDISAAKLLISKNADIDVADSTGRTPISIARKKGFDNIVRFLTSGYNPPAASSVEMVGCESIKEVVSRPPWLSLPLSRLVINPTKFIQRPVQDELCPSLPLDIAYFSGSIASPISYCWAWQPGSFDLLHSAVTAGPTVDLTPDSWHESGIKAEFEGAQVKLTVPNGTNFGALAGKVKVDLDETPFLIVNVVQAKGSMWALKVQGEGDSSDRTVIGDTPEIGSYMVDLRQSTGWQGKKSFSILLFAIGNPGSSVTYSGLSFLGVKGKVPSFTAKDTTWYPHQIVVEAESMQPEIKVETSTCLADESTIVQLLHVRKAKSQTLTLVGQFPAKSVQWDAVRRTFILQSDGFQAAISVSRKGRWLGLFPSWGDWLTGRARPQAMSGVWAIAFDEVKTGDDITVAISFAQSGSSPQTLADTAYRYATPAAFQTTLRRRADYWDSLLQKTPHPLDFRLNLLETRGTTPESIKRMYYKAWCFLLTNTLPPMQENQFPFPQILCGKASLWRDGHPKAVGTAQWDSVIGSQLLALVDPDTAWGAFEGLMWLVGPDGRLEGEGLPTRHAQTAWILYSLTGNENRLRSVYPAVKRLVLWKSEHRTSIGVATLAEHECVVHVIMDFIYARRIADVLNMPDDFAFWQRKIEEIAQVYPSWFWDASGTFCELSNMQGGHDYPNRFLGIQGLVLPPEVLKDKERESLMKLYQSLFNKDVPFLIAGFNRHPNYTFAMLGLWQYGYINEAAMMAEAAIRDVTLAGEFAEGYSLNYPVTCTGVTPSVFGAADIISCALWHNGVIPDDGLPIIAHLPNAVGVSNLTIYGLPISVRYAKSGDGVELQGPGLNLFAVPTGFTVAKTSGGTPRWQGNLPVGKQIYLQRLHKQRSQ